METKLLERIRTILAQFPEYWEHQELIKSKVIDAIRSNETGLLTALLGDDLVKARFILSIGGAAVFNKEAFLTVFESKDYWGNSYTKFSNEIGLASEGKYLRYTSDVVIDFPYKDCVLEGGQSKEEQAKDEIYYHNVIAGEEIDVLLAPKVMTKVQRYSEAGTEREERYNEDDNFIIKGNNLLALSSLRERYTNRVKLIYIDPPYNTESDSFQYNDRFSQSTWLVFTKNRLEIAKELLREKDGVIAVQCSFHQYAYLKVLMDEIFGVKNFVVTFHVLVRHPDRALTADKEFNDVIEYILLYSKSPAYSLPKRKKEKTDDDYVYSIETDGPPSETIIRDGKAVEVYLPHQYTVVKGEPSPDKVKSISIRGSLREKNSSGRFYVKHLEELIGQYPPLTLFKVPNMGDDKLGHRYFHLPKEGNKNGSYFQGKPQGTDVTEIPYPNFFDFVEAYNRVNYEGNVEFRNGKKPEELMQFLITLLTDERDLVLDYHLGSGTTCAVAHKLNRKYIGIEQLDYIEHITVQRMIGVVQGDDTGISAEVQWQGGGSFVYMELMELNQRFGNEIRLCESKAELQAILRRMLGQAYLNFKVELAHLLDRLEEWNELSLEDQKSMLYRLLDQNQLYVNYSEIDDETFQIDGGTKRFNLAFYGDGNE